MSSRFSEVFVTRMTLEKIINQIDNIERLLSISEVAEKVKITLAMWLSEARTQLRILKENAEDLMH